MKNENAIMDRIKARIAYHANEHRHTYEIGKGGGLNEEEKIKPSEVEI